MRCFFGFTGIFRRKLPAMSFILMTALWCLLSPPLGSSPINASERPATAEELSVQSGMPVPSGPNAFAYHPVPVPILSEDPAKARPIGVGPVSIDHDLTLQIGLEAFVSRVDIYLIMYMPALSDTFFFFQPDGSLAPFPAGFKPWKSGKTQTVKNNLLGTIPLYLLPSGDYVFFLLAIPKGTPPASLGKNFTLWTTTVENLRVSDMANRAASLGGDAKAAATIIMALGRDYSLKTVADAVMAGKLKKFGEIEAGATKQLQTSDKDIPPICGDAPSLFECKSNLITALKTLSDEVDEALTEWNKAPKEFERLITAFTTYLGSIGYSGAQISDAILGTYMGGDTKIYIPPHPYCTNFPLGGIVKAGDSYTGCGDFIEPEIDRDEIAGLFSDMDPDDFASMEPGTKGMTFPAYYKGTGSVIMFYSNPNFGEVGCVMEKLVHVARVGGGGYWDGRLKVYSSVYPTTTGTDGLKCLRSKRTFGVAEGYYTDGGEYKEIFNTETYSGAAIVKFNKHGLWGGVMGTDSRDVYGGKQITKREWYFDLYECTEAEFNAVANK